MTTRAWWPALALVIVACTGGASTTTRPLPGPPPTTAPPATAAPTTSAPTTTVPAIEPLVGALPQGPCAMDPVLAGGEAAIVSGGLLLGLSHDGVTVRCLADGMSGVRSLAWGPVGDRVLYDSTILLADGTHHPIAQAPDRTPSWTAPTGIRIVSIVDGQPVKTEVDGSAPELIGFLEKHDELVYHPAGTHYVTTGTQPDGEYGLWLARNDGQAWVLAAADESAVLTSPGWTADGHIVFVAHHEDRYDLHRIFRSEDGSMYEQLDLESGQKWLGQVMASPYNPALVAYAEGGADAEGCSDGRMARVSGVDLPQPLDAVTSLPIGWLPDDRLVVAVYPNGCDGLIDVWVFTSGFCPGTEYGAEFLVADAEAVSARVAMPPPPPSPDDFSNLPDPAPA